MKLTYSPGTRYSNSEYYDQATEEVVHGWQVFMQYTPEGKPTGSKSFVDNNGILCGISIAAPRRREAMHQGAPDLLAAAIRARDWIAQRMADDGCPSDRLDNPPEGSHLHALDVAIFKARGIDTTQSTGDLK